MQFGDQGFVHRDVVLTFDVETRNHAPGSARPVSVLTRQQPRLAGATSVEAGADNARRPALNVTREDGPGIAGSSPNSSCLIDCGGQQMTRIHFIGGEKGGVGKSVLARLLAQYYIDHQRPFTAFDGDLSHGALIRYYAEYAQPVDIARFESADRIAEMAAESGNDVIVDLAAQAARPLDHWMNETGLLELGKELGVAIALWHVMDDGTDSVRLLGELLDTHGENPEYVVVRNLGRGGDFSLFDGSEERVQAEALGACIMDLPGLHAATMRKIDRVGASLWAAANNQDGAFGPTLSLLERHRVKIWLGKAYAELDRVLDAGIET